MMLKLCLFLAIITASKALSCDNGCINIESCPNQNPPCQDPYCVYVKEMNLYTPGQMSVYRGCSVIPSVQYAQSMRPYDLLNTCSSIVVDQIEYNVKICNLTDYCNSECSNPIPYNPTATTYAPWTQWPTTRTSGAEIFGMFVPVFMSLIFFLI